jgi:large subunit ribosomal protein L24
MKDWSKSWKASKNPSKQRKYRYNAPLHVQQNFMGVHLSPELRKKYETRTISVRTGDKVRVLRGQFSKKTGKVSEVKVKLGKVYVEGIEHVKRDGSKTFIPLNPSNLMITELILDDKRRKKKLMKEEVKKESKNNG